MDIYSEWPGEAALLRHYNEVRARLRTPPNAVQDTGINLVNGQPERKTELEAPPPRQILPSQYKQKVKSYLHSYRTSFCSKDEHLNIRTVLKFVAKQYGSTMAIVMSHRRTQPLVLVRQVAVHLTAKHTTYSNKSMALYLGMNHTTLYYSKDTIARIMAEKGPEADKINDIEAKLLAAFPRASFSAFYKQPVAVQPGAGP